jgi:hypothetical protein
MESLILAQNERWRRGLGMQVERAWGFGSKLVATWSVQIGLPARKWGITPRNRG